MCYLVLSLGLAISWLTQLYGQLWMRKDGKGQHFCQRERMVIDPHAEICPSIRLNSSGNKIRTRGNAGHRCQKLFFKAVKLRHQKSNHTRGRKLWMTQPMKKRGPCVRLECFTFDHGSLNSANTFDHHFYCFGHISESTHES
jgi:hypothetical protein